MNQVTIRCRKCGEAITLSYHTTLGHALTDEALAIERAIKTHQCKVPNKSRLNKIGGKER